MTDNLVRTEVLVIGSGAGGALTAALLAEAGRSVVVVEDGPWIDPDALAPYSVDEMTTKFKHGGLNSTVGLPPIAFVEGRCVGGGTEINSGLYHRLPDDIINGWSRRNQIADFTPALMERYAVQVEQALSVSLAEGPVPAASLALERGAQHIGLKAVEIPRAFRPDGAGSSTAVKQTMTRTFIPRALAAGARVIPHCRATRILHKDGRAQGAVCRVTDESGNSTTMGILADNVFVCAGATATPAILRRSGIRKNIGGLMKVHPMIKMAARFDQPLDDHSGVPMHQVRDLDRYISYGCSVSRPGYVALALGENWGVNVADIDEWRNIAVYYACIRTDSHGKLRNLPGVRWPVLTYQLTESDMSRLARSLIGLGELLFAAGANNLYPSILGTRAISHPRGLADLWTEVTRSRVTLTAVHLFCGVTMGEDASTTGADSFGRVWGFENLFVNDSSLLPDAPGVNPQGTIMAIAARNSDHFLAGG